MMGIIYRSSIFVYDVSNPEIVRAGMVATFCGNRVVKVCDHRSLPIGFFTQDLSEDSFPPYVSSVGFETTAAVAVGHGEYRTDVFEKGLQYNINDFLYCSSNGLITNEYRYAGNIIIGIVNAIDNDILGFVTCFRRGLEESSVLRDPSKPGISRYDLAKKGIMEGQLW